MIKIIMINRVVILTKYIKLHQIATYSTTTLSDPYYILGVDKTAEFSQIKKAFYKLANQYHPDKVSDDPETAKKFLLVKQAYEAIKLQKGITKPSGFVYDTDVKSMRPDPSRFQTDDEQNRRSNTDYRMHQQKAEASGAEYDQFKTSFKTLNDINDIKIKVEKGVMKDAASRFKLDDLKANIRRFSSNSWFYLLFVFASGGSFFYFQVSRHSKNQIKQLQDSITIQQSKQNKRKIFDANQSKTQTYLKQIENNPEIQQYLTQTSKKDKSLNKNYMAKKQQVVSGENCV